MVSPDPDRDNGNICNSVELFDPLYLRCYTRDNNFMSKKDSPAYLLHLVSTVKAPNCVIKKLQDFKDPCL